MGTRAMPDRGAEGGNSSLTARPASAARRCGLGGLLALVLVTTAPGAHADPGRVPKPQIVIEKTGQCIAAPERMRREHAEMLRHQRDETVRQGVRGAKASLKECIECHASRESGSVAARREDFCASCHLYTGVKPDCFECHSAKPKTAAQPAPRATPGNVRVRPGGEAARAQASRGAAARTVQ